MKKARTAMLFTPSIEECRAAAVKEGMPEREGDKMFVHYELSGWRYGKAKVPITSLALVAHGWKLRWQDQGCPGVPKHHTNGTGTGSVSGADKMIMGAEYQRVLERMKVLRSYDSHAEMLASDRDEYKKLVARRNELRTILGITV